MFHITLESEFEFENSKIVPFYGNKFEFDKAEFSNLKSNFDPNSIITIGTPDLPIKLSNYRLQITKFKLISVGNSIITVFAHPQVFKSTSLLSDGRRDLGREEGLVWTAIFREHIFQSPFTYIYKIATIIFLQKIQKNAIQTSH